MSKQRAVSLLITFLLGVLIWFLPHTPNIPDKAWHMLAIFVATIVGVILKPFPMGALSIMAIAIATFTKTLTLEETLAGFHSSIVWLVVFAFFISRGFIKTGLGSRIAYYFVALFGKRTLGLGYSLVCSDLILAPAVPSVTARAGGVVYPVARGLAKSFGSDPETGTQRHIGSYLTFVAYQGSVISSAMFLTAMAANPFLAGLLKDMGYAISWGQWALAGIVPGILSLLVMPLVVYKLIPPTIKETPDAAAMAKRKLKEMGKLTLKEGLMAVIFVLLLFLWIFGSFFHVHATVAALFGLALIILLQILDWKEITHEASAWDTFIWFSVLIMLATSLSRLGFTPWLSEQTVRFVGNMSWPIAFAILSLIYFYAHYFFASNTAHVGAMFPAFFMVAVGLGTPPFYAILVLAFFSNLAGGLTQYGSGPAPLYYGSGYIDIKDWWKTGFVLSVINIAIFVGIGSFWWKFVGLI
ncbi:MAG: putative malate transporter YflS [Chlamydiales bacterium]|nr:putative malate transporter YflS [Chlamydiales bacterium]MCH9635236.1 putative malate transporter YflS [Chlamydiales bacterium]MCH9704028.1 anion permease [Chlamydiota bacterium]